MSHKLFSIVAIILTIIIVLLAATVLAVTKPVNPSVTSDAMTYQVEDLQPTISGGELQGVR